MRERTKAQGFVLGLLLAGVAVSIVMAAADFALAQHQRAGLELIVAVACLVVLIGILGTE